MASWDVFHSDRLEIERALDTEAVRTAMARGELHGDDLIRPAGTAAAWTRLADFTPPVAPPSSTPEADPRRSRAPGDAEDITASDAPDQDQTPEYGGTGGDEDEDGAGRTHARDPEPSRFDLDLERDTARRQRVDLSNLELIPWDADIGADAEEGDPLADDEEAASFTLSRGDPEKVEELDLAAMVDVAFQLVLFFLVTATTVLYKTLEVPRPNPESAAAGATQGKSHSLNDLKNDYILVEIATDGAMKIDREPVAAEMSALVQRLRSAREATGRKAMLLSADALTPHRNAVLAYDAANEIGLGIAIARPAPGGGR